MMDAKEWLKQHIENLRNSGVNRSDLITDRDVEALELFAAAQNAELQQQLDNAKTDYSLLVSDYKDLQQQVERLTRSESAAVQSEIRANAEALSEKQRAERAVNECEKLRSILREEYGRTDV